MNGEPLGHTTYSAKRAGARRTTGLQRRLCFQLLMAFSLGCCVLEMVGPTLWNLTQTVPQGFESAPTVPLLNVWTVGWNADRAWHGWSSYWNSPHFHPLKESFALSEPIVTSFFVAPIVWVTGTPVAGYNIFLLGNLWLNGWITWHLLQARGCRWLVALFGACLVIRLPFIHRHMGVLQMVPLTGILATIHFTTQAFDTGRNKQFCWAGISLGLTYLTCAYYGLFLALLLPVCVCVAYGKQITQRLVNLNRPIVRPISIRRWLEFGTQGVFLEILLAALLICPIALAQHRALQYPNYERPLELIRDLSALPGDYLETPFPELLRFDLLARNPDPTRWSFSPGLWKYALAICGLWLGLRVGRRRSWTLFLFMLTAGAFVGSLGLNLQLMGWSPYSMLLDWIPGLAKIRTPGRFALFVQIGVALLGMEALHFWQRWGAILWRRANCGRCSRSCLDVAQWTSFLRLHISWPYAAVWVGGLLACCEVSLPSVQLVHIPAARVQQGWLGWIEKNTPPDAVIAHLPFPAGKSPNDYESEAWAMYWGLFHGRRLINGYSGFFPPSYLKRKAQMQRFPDRDSIEALRDSGVRYCVIQESFAQSRQIETNQLVLENLEFLFRDELAGLLVFAVHPAPKSVVSDQKSREPD